MLLFGHRFIPSESFYHVTNIEAITNTPPSSLIYLNFSEENLDIITHLQKNELAFALYVSDVTETIYAEAFAAKYIVVHRELAKIVQDIAETYLFDAKILVRLESESEIEEMALLGVDGVLFANAVVKTNA